MIKTQQRSLFVYLVSSVFLAGAFLVVGVLAFPGGWSDPSVQEVCGPSARHFYPGQCGLRWAYILAMIGVADVLVLAALAFTLAVRHVKLLSLQPYPIIYKGMQYINNSKKNWGRKKERKTWLMSFYLVFRWSQSRLRQRRAPITTIFHQHGLWPVGGHVPSSERSRRSSRPNVRIWYAPDRSFRQ